MIPYFVFDHIQIGSVKFYSWGFFVGLAFAAGYFLLLREAKKKNIGEDKILFLSLVIFLGALFGSRLFFLLESPGDFWLKLGLFWKFGSGLALYGGLLGAIAVGRIYLKIVKLNFWQIADLAAPAVALGIGIGRIGCFLINDHQGAQTSLPWGILWPGGIARHPVALYESLFGFVLFYFLYKFYKNGNWAGERFLMLLVLYSAGRFFLDFFREAKGFLADPRYWGLTASQWTAIVLLIICGMVFLRKMTRLR